MAARFGNVRFVWIRPPSGMGNECKRRADLFEPMLLGMMGDLRGEIIAYMKSNAPWKDRTTAARNALNASANITGKGSVTLSAFHGVPYGGYLETGTAYNPWTGGPNQPYPIVGPACQAFYPKVRKVMDILAGSG